MKILVTGGAGYIGSHTSNLLLKQGYDVVVMDDLSTGFKQSLNPLAPIYIGSTADAIFLEKVFSTHKFNAVIHFAAKLVVPESVEKPELYYHNNITGTCVLLKKCVEAGVQKFIFSSTASVYGDSSGGVVSEDSVCKPMNPYGRTKLFVEQMLKDFSHAYGLRSAILRYFNVAGASEDLSNGQRTRQATHLIKVASEAALGIRPHVRVWGGDYETYDGTCIRDYLHVEDLAQAHVNALEYLNNSGGTDIFNCGYGKGYSVLEVLKTMQTVSANKFQIIMDQRREGDPFSVVAKNDKIKNILGWKPKFNNLEIICKSALDWERKIRNSDAL